MQNELSLPLHHQTELPMTVFLDTVRETPCVGCNRPDGKIIAYPHVESFQSQPPTEEAVAMFLLIVFVVIVYVACVYSISLTKPVGVMPGRT